MSSGWKVACAAAALVALSGCEKARLDEELRRLCAIDGGVRVYETVNLPPEKFDKFGSVSVPSKDMARPEDEYFYELKVDYIKKGNPAVVRLDYRVIRRADGKVLGESVRYGRGGGDLPSPMHDSSFTCPEISPDQPGIDRLIFVKE